MKKQIFIYIYLAFSVFFITEISFSAQKGKPNNKNKSLLKIRKKPNKKAAILAKVKDGEEFDVISTNQKGWHNVNFKGVKGWANGKYVEVTGVPDENNNTDNEKELPESAKKVPDIIETSLKAQIKNLGATDNKAEVDYTIPDDFADVLNNHK